MRRTACPIVSEGDIGVNIRSFARALRAESVSPKTIETYLELAGQLADILSAQGMPLDVADIRREQVKAFIADLLERFKPATANNRYRGLQCFFKWLVEEGGQPLLVSSARFPLRRLCIEYLVTVAEAAI